MNQFLKQLFRMQFRQTQWDPLCVIRLGLTLLLWIHFGIPKRHRPISALPYLVLGVWGQRHRQGVPYQHGVFSPLEKPYPFPFSRGDQALLGEEDDSGAEEMEGTNTNAHSACNHLRGNTTGIDTRKAFIFL